MLYSLILGPIVAGVLAILFHFRNTRKLIIGIQALIVMWTSRLFYIVRSGSTVIEESMGGWPANLSITLLADSVSIVFVLVTTFLFFIMLLYAYSEDYFTTQFGFLFLVLESLIITLFLSTDLFNLFIMLEVSTVVVSILIMINKEKQAIYDGMIYFFVNVIGSSFLLFGIGFLYRTFGYLDMRAIGEVVGNVSSPRSLILPFAFMMTTLSLKTAVIPLFSWLPKAHGTPSAPPVVSAILSGLYIKTGVYLFIRFSDMFAPAIEVQKLFLTIGFLTSVVGFVMAIGQDDIKLLLAYSTVSQIGLIMIGLTMGSEEAFWGSMYHIMSHALFKSALFLAAGIVTHEYGTRSIQEIRGIFKKIPLTGAAIALGILGVTGAPLFNGSISKYMISHGSSMPVMQYALNLINLGTMIYFVKLSAIIFGEDMREESGTEEAVHSSSSQQCIVLLMGILIFATGIFGSETLQFLFGYEVSINTAEYIEKAIVYFLMIIAAIGFNKGVIKKGGLIYRIGHIELTFNAIITAMTGYFIFLVVLLQYVYGY